MRRFALLAAGLALAGCSLADVQRINRADNLVQGQVSRALAQLKGAAPAGDTFDFALVGDSRGGLPVLKQELAEIDAYHPAFVIYTGDLVGEGTEDEYRAGLEVLQTVHAPVVPAVGNHERRNGGIRWYYQLFGKDADYAFDYGKWRFVCLDNSTGGLTAAQIAWLQVELQGGQHRVVFAHMPPPFGIWRIHSFNGNAKDFEAAVEQAKVDACLFGHIHLYDHTVKNGIQYVVSGGGGAPLYRLIGLHARDGGAFYHYIIGHATPQGVTFDLHKPGKEFTPTFVTEDDPA